MAWGTFRDISASYETNFVLIYLDDFILTLLPYFYDITKSTITKKNDSEIVSVAEN